MVVHGDGDGGCVAVMVVHGDGGGGCVAQASIQI